MGRFSRRGIYMIKFRSRDKVDVRTMISGLVILTICLIACIFHISDLYGSYKTRLNTDYVEQTTEAYQEFSDSAKEIKTQIEEIAETILAAPGEEKDESEVYSFSNPEWISVILEDYMDSGYQSLVYLSSEGLIVDSNGYNDTGIYHTIQDTISIYKNTMIVLEPSIAVTGDVCFVMFITPVVDNNVILGHVIGLCTISDMLTGNVYQSISEDSDYYIITNTGKILISSKKSSQNDPNIIYEQLMDTSDQSSITKTALNYMKRFVTKAYSINFTYNNADGTIECVIGQQLDITENSYVVVTYNEDELLADIKPVILRSVLTCIIIILLMICLIIYVWASAKQANITIEKLAYEDNVTNGKNANYFRDKAVHIIATNRETPFIAQRFDICNFRYINEAYGHNKADDILKACIDLSYKFFSEKELCVRMDSDQFLMLNINDSRVDQKRSDYMEAVNEYARSIGIKYPIRLKFGVYQVRKQDLDIDLIIDRANVARKSLDGEEKKLIAYYSDAIVQDMRKVDRIESEMTRALENGEFKIYMQPKWDIVNNRLYGAEALVRWVKPDGTVVFPGNFIPVFEKNGFIERLDFYMLESVCHHMQDRMEEGHKICPVSVNQSRLLLHNPEYINNISKVLKSHDIPRKYVELELTETVFFDDRDKMIEMMNQLKKQHVKLSMDDFGSGYSSLNLLKDIPFDILKIDREFFSEAITSESSTWILQKIIEMAEGLGIEVICEGVESADQIEKLKTVGCRFVQGYYYSKPIPIAEFEEKYLA